MDDARVLRHVRDGNPRFYRARSGKRFVRRWLPERCRANRTGFDRQSFGLVWSISGRRVALSACPGPGRVTSLVAAPSVRSAPLDRTALASAPAQRHADVAFRYSHLRDELAMPAHRRLPARAAHGRVAGRQAPSAGALGREATGITSAQRFPLVPEVVQDRGRAPKSPTPSEIAQVRLSRSSGRSTPSPAGPFCRGQGDEPAHHRDHGTFNNATYTAPAFDHAC